MSSLFALGIGAAAYAMRNRNMNMSMNFMDMGDLWRSKRIKRFRKRIAKAIS
jgi:hypothetical protein